MKPDPTPAPEPLFADFDAATRAAWEQAARDSLKGGSLEKIGTRLLEGFALGPIQDAGDLEGLEATTRCEEPAPPAADPARPAAWTIRQDLEATTLEEALAQLVHDAAREGRHWTLRPASTLRRGGSGSESWRPGLALASAGELCDLLAALPVGATLRVEAGAGWRGLADAASSDDGVEWLVDPIEDLLLCGKGPDPVALLAAVAADPRALLRCGAVLPAEAGAHAAQELAFLFGLVAEGLRGLLAAGLDAPAAAARLRLELGVGHELFLQTAKLRAARFGVARILEAFGLPAELRRPPLHGRGLQRAQTKRDPWTNLLRAPLQGVAAACAGVDGLHLPTFVEGLGAPMAFHRRLAFNAQTILQEEAHLDKVQDPLRGGWLTETLTDSLGRAAWLRFQEIERSGGLFAVLAAGTLQADVAATLATRRQRLAERRDILVGSNQYANLGETLPALRPAVEGPCAGELAAACAAAVAGFPVVRWPALRPARLAEPLEALRTRADAQAFRCGERPVVHLATFGPLKAHKARADYVRGFLACGGLDAEQGDGAPDPVAAANEAFDGGRCAVVACGLDDMYPEWIPAFCAELDRLEGEVGRPRALRLLAGFPEDQLDAHRAAGIDGFVHLRADLPATIERLFESLEVPA